MFYQGIDRKRTDCNTILRGTSENFSCSPGCRKKKKKDRFVTLLEYLETGWIIWKVLEGFGIVPSWL